MKGTLFSADFIKDNSGNLRLLEINTDTSFVSASYLHLDYGNLFDILSTNNIDTLEVIYKDFHIDFVNHLSQSLYNSELNLSSFVHHLEEINNIYPTSIDDSTDKFILRLSYDESALFDSIYAKNNIELYKLFVDNSDTSSIVEFAYSSSEFYHDNLGTDTLNNTELPDIVIKNSLTSYTNPLEFYKIGHSISSSEERLSLAKNEIFSSDSFVQKYYPGESSDNKVKSIRSFNIVYGTNLDVTRIGEYEIESILEKPSNLEIDDFNILYHYDVKHYFEFTTNGIRGFAGGILEGASIQPATGSPILIEDVEVGTVFKSFIVGTSPNTDVLSEVREWSYPGSELPSGSMESTSTLVNKTREQLVYNVISNISISGSSEDSLRISPHLYMLTYDIVNDQLCYRSPLEMSVSTHKLFDNSGSLVELDSITYEVLEGENFVYELDMEEADTFFLQGVGINVRLLTHNCFVAGTEISTPSGKVSIENIQPGDIVLSFDEESGNVIENKVGKVSKAIVNDLVKLTFDNGKVLQTTKKHPFHVESKGWVEAENLVDGDVCSKLDGSKVSLLSIEIFEGEHFVYNLHNVEPSHTFYTNEILVHNKCFVAGTEITLSNGDVKNIEDVVVGEEVLTYNEESGVNENGVVGDLKQHEVHSVIRLTLDNENIIITTHEHPFFVEDKGWVKAGELQPLDVCKKVDGSESLISTVEVLEETHMVYNLLSVSENHNFYANGILVHNK
jgi:hypothetical protein